MLSLCLVSCVLCLSVQPALAQDGQARRVSVHLQEVFDAKVSVIPFVGGKADYKNPVEEVAGIKDGETAVINVPAEYLPGEFVLRLDYRAKQSDYPYPAERIIFLNDQDIQLTINPPYINNDLRTKFQDGEKENTVYAAFMKENAANRAPVEALMQFLMSYDRTGSVVYTEAVKEFKQRREDYNKWLGQQAQAHQDLFVSRLFQFQRIPSGRWDGGPEEHVKDVLNNYFDGIDFNDLLIIRLRVLTQFMDRYMKLSGMEGQTKEERNVLFIQAGEKVQGKASAWHPQVRAWLEEYLRKGYQAQGIEK